MSDGERAAECEDAIVEPEDVAERAVALHFDYQPAVAMFDLDEQGRRMALPDDFRDAEIRGRFGGWAETLVREGRDLDRDGGVFDQRLEGGGETLVGEHGGEDAVRAFAELGERRGQFRLRILDVGETLGIGVRSEARGCEP